ncbi:uncharacterized protein V6R79_021050 [Siganus canaliculatus]
MVRQQRRPDRCLLPASVSDRLPVNSAQRPPTHQVKHPDPGPSGLQGTGPLWTLKRDTGSSDSRPCCTPPTTEEDDKGPGPGGGSGEPETKRARLDRAEEAAALTSRKKALGSCDHPGSESGSSAETSSRLPAPDQQRAAEHGASSRAAELQSVAALKVTIQQKGQSREFGAERATGLHCYVCALSCRSLQLFQDHMTGSDHLRKLNDITTSISLNTHTLQDRGRHRWCHTCQTHFNGDVIIHRRTEQHKTSKQLCRPFCPVCERHFRTPRKFVEHMKSAEHKQQVQQEEPQEEELITVDAVGCFEEEEEEGGGAADEEEEHGVGVEEEEERALELLWMISACVSVTFVRTVVLVSVQRQRRGRGLSAVPPPGSRGRLWRVTLSFRFQSADRQRRLQTQTQTQTQIQNQNQTQTQTSEGGEEPLASG